MDLRYDSAAPVAWAHEVARQMLADVLPTRWAHVCSVGDEARRIADMIGEPEVLEAAAVLHDVGYAPAIATSGFHPLDGARFLAGLGAPERLCALVARHSCAIREAAMRGLEEEVGAYADEATPIRDALWYCDMVTGPAGDHVTMDERIAEIQSRYGPGDLVTRFVGEARGDLRAAVDRTLGRLGSAGCNG